MLQFHQNKTEHVRCLSSIKLNWEKKWKHFHFVSLNLKNCFNQQRPIVPSSPAPLLLSIFAYLYNFLFYFRFFCFYSFFSHFGSAFRLAVGSSDDLSIGWNVVTWPTGVKGKIEDPSFLSLSPSPFISLFLSPFLSLSLTTCSWGVGWGYSTDSCFSLNDALKQELQPSVTIILTMKFWARTRNKLQCSFESNFPFKSLLTYSTFISMSLPYKHSSDLYWIMSKLKSNGSFTTFWIFYWICSQDMIEGICFDRGSIHLFW